MSIEHYELEFTTRPTTTVKFSLSGENLSPTTISETLGISPSKAWFKGDAIPRKKGSTFTPRPTYPFGRWILHAPCSQYDDFEIQINALLNILENLPIHIYDLIKKYNGEISIACSSGQDNIGFHLESSIIQRIMTLNVSIDIIVYPVGDEEG